MSRQRLRGVLPNLFVAREDGLATDSVQSGPLRFGELSFVHPKLKVGHGGLNFVPDFRRDPVLENDIEISDRAALVILPNPGSQMLEQFALFDLQQRRQGPGNFCLVLPNNDRVGVNGFDNDGSGQEIAFSVEDISPPWLEEVFVLGVLLSSGTKVFVPQHLQIDQSVAQPGEGR